jgi:hypothetical protein
VQLQGEPLKFNSLPHINLYSHLPRTGNSSVSTVTKLRAGRSGFDSRQGHGLIFLAPTSRPALEPYQFCYPMGTGGSFSGSKAA